MSYGRVTESDPQRDYDGLLPAFAFPGGYPILYSDGWNITLCAKCATEYLNKTDCVDVRDKPTTWFIHYEGPPEICFECNKSTDSAYGDPFEEE